ncbi:hypothetical protein [Lederbergia citrea]|uniref:Uncharacterized protein n=1 Tax=Lederbergia citrea TaxID=2833581 RepID=A0A942UPB9_9BACI|nr:hypothetical protein [Lederbergia citrea]MBS4179611.1 hypothetical protein [Lederbergia citrea]MBS4225010.1 hypothetical protein [Lederbergia citrea]
MLGILISEGEKEEIIYLLKREMEEILFDMDDSRVEQIIKQAMEDRYRTLFSLFKRVASQQDCAKYIPLFKRNSKNFS